MFRSTAIFLFFFTALVVTGGLSWLALGNYHSAAPIAQENLRSLALTMASAMEGVATRDPSLKSLISFHSPEMAYAILISTQGEILFHSNADLVGSAMMDSRYQLPLQNGNFDEERIRLGTGEMVYEFQTSIHFANQTCILRLALHTWRADGVMRRAQQEMQIIFSLLIIGWILALVIISLLRKQMWLQRQSARQRELARLGEVGAVLAHEIRNPLAGIKGYAQLLEERLPDGKERDFASLIVNEARRMESLTHDILLYSRSESLVPEPCPLAPVTATVLQLLALQAQEHGVHFFCDIADDLFVLCPRAVHAPQIMLDTGRFFMYTLLYEIMRPDIYEREHRRYPADS